MTSKEISSVIIKQFSSWKEKQEEMDGKKLCARDFDVWIGGYVAGATSPDVGIPLMVHFKEIIDTLIGSDVVKSCGVTGTVVESLDFTPI